MNIWRPSTATAPNISKPFWRRASCRGSRSRSRNYRRHPEVLAVLYGEPRRMDHKRPRPSFQTPRKRAAPQDDGGIKRGFMGEAWRFRNGTLDQAIFNGVVLFNEYRLPDRFAPGDIVIDVGAHIGSFAEAVLSRGCEKV